MILEFARRVSFPPGSNRIGAVAPPAWAYLLPHLDGWRLETIGEVPPRAVAGLRDWADANGEHRLLLIGRGSGSAIAEALGDSVDVAVHATADVADEVSAALGVRTEFHLEPAPADSAASEPPIHPGAAGGERVAIRVPGLPGAIGARSVRSRALRVLERFAQRAGLRRPPGGRVAADDPSGVPLALTSRPPASAAQRDVFFPPMTSVPQALPAWILRLARDAGVDLAEASWRLVPSRGFRSQKVLFLVTRAPGESGVAVKVTQDPGFNTRLENEYHGLAALSALEQVEPGTFPAPLFLGHHRGLAVVGEAAIEGSFFRARASGTARCPHAATALDWLEDLAAASAQPTRAADLAAAVEPLVERFLAIYTPGGNVERVLRRDVETLALLEGVPTVFVHGDPGPWNLLVTPGDRVAFLDWENAESRGLPLWDLLYFLRTYGALMAERRGIRWTPRVFARQFLEETDLSALFETRILAHTSRLGVPSEAVPALLRTNLAAYAAREAWSLDPHHLRRGVSVRLLELIVERADASPVWRRLGPPR